MAGCRGGGPGQGLVSLWLGWTLIMGWVSGVESSECIDGIEFARGVKPANCPSCPVGAFAWRGQIHVQTDRAIGSIHATIETAPCGCGFAEYGVTLERTRCERQPARYGAVGNISFRPTKPGQNDSIKFEDVICGCTYRLLVDPIFKHKDKDGLGRYKKCCPYCDGGCNPNYNQWCTRSTSVEVTLECPTSSISSIASSTSSTSSTSSPSFTSSASSTGSTSGSPSSIDSSTSGTITHPDPRVHFQPHVTVPVAIMHGPASASSPMNTLQEISPTITFRTGETQVGDNEPMDMSKKVREVVGNESHTIPIIVALSLAIILLFICIIFGKIVKSAISPVWKSKGHDHATNVDVPEYNADEGITNYEGITMPALEDDSNPEDVSSKDPGSDVKKSVRDDGGINWALPSESGGITWGWNNTILPVESSTEQEQQKVTTNSMNNSPAPVLSPAPVKSLALEDLSRKRVFIVYSDDHKLHKNVVQCLATYLQQMCNCEVIFDEWCMLELGEDVLSWVLREIDRADKCLIVISEGAHAHYRAHLDKTKLEYNISRPKGDVFTPAMRKIKQQFHDQTSGNKFIHVSFPYSEKNMCGQDFIIRDIYPGMHFTLMDHIENLVMNIHGLLKLTPGYHHDLSGVNRDEYSNQEEGKALKAAIGKMIDFVKENPDWFSGECQYSPMYLDSGFSTMNVEDFPPDKGIPAPTGGNPSISRSNSQESDTAEARLSSVLPDHLFLSSDECVPSKPDTSMSQSMPIATSADTPTKTGPAMGQLPSCCGTDYHCNRAPFISPDAISHLFEIGAQGLKGSHHPEEIDSTLSQICQDMVVQNEISNMSSYHPNISPDQFSIKTASMSDVLDFLEDGSISDADCIINMKPHMGKDGDVLYLNGHNDEDDGISV